MNDYVLGVQWKEFSRGDAWVPPHKIAYMMEEDMA